MAVERGFWVNRRKKLKASNGENRRPALQRKLPIANGSFLEAQFKSFADTSAVIHDGQQ
jgi:hypothetical protein